VPVVRIGVSCYARVLEEDRSEEGKVFKFVAKVETPLDAKASTLVSSADAARQRRTAAQTGGRHRTCDGATGQGNRLPDGDRRA